VGVSTGAGAGSEWASAWTVEVLASVACCDWDEALTVGGDWEALTVDVLASVVGCDWDGALTAEALASVDVAA
jgi:hypothetical protein